MQVILLKSIERLGAVGDIVEVADGYARNWLLPQKYGMEATPENIRQVQDRKRKILAQEAETLQKLQALAAEIAKQSVTIMARATEEAHLFGSVGPREIAAAFAQENIEIDPKTVLLDEPIKELGCYNVKIRLHPEVEVTSKVWVVPADKREESPEDEGPKESGDEEAGADRD